MSKSIMSDICREFGETSSGSGSVSPPPNPPVQGQVLTNKKYTNPVQETAAEAIYVYRDRRAGDQTLRRRGRTRKVRHVQRVPDQVVKRVLVLGDICIRRRPRRVY
jgi:hypothetical protein